MYVYVCTEQPWRELTVRLTQMEPGYETPEKMWPEPANPIFIPKPTAPEWPQNPDSPIQPPWWAEPTRIRF